jgi:sarcosine oxidase subunit beta
LPQLEFVPYPLLVEGFYDVTPDHQPILGMVDTLEGLWLAAGFSGHGFMMAPAIGRRRADAIVGASRDRCLDDFSVARFEADELTHELQIV